MGNDIVALLVDYRHFNVCTDGLSYAGVALRLQHVIKERLWHVPGLATQHDVPMINFQWTDFDQRHGFIQQPSVVDWKENSLAPVSLVVDQPEHHLWRLRA